MSQKLKLMHFLFSHLSFILLLIQFYSLLYHLLEAKNIKLQKSIKPKKEKNNFVYTLVNKLNLF